ncbi:unnamed protein product [Paramecium sonneborni]|uniref:Uncharacterized protein n=1 Tax=Paramecium sonneborni TaxID=65129 RepID=A0A8S1PH95_9CILI|nr:unnamed protein product [Paramecium sonneborni]
MEIQRWFEIQEFNHPLQKCLQKQFLWFLQSLGKQLSFQKIYQIQKQE